VAHEQRVLAPGSVAEQYWRRAMAGFQGPAALVAALPPPRCDAADAEVGLLAAVRLYYANYSLFATSRQPQPPEGVAPLGEDAAVGLRLHVARVGPLHCECFYQGPPCADGAVSLNASECVVSARWLTASLTVG